MSSSTHNNMHINHANFTSSIPTTGGIVLLLKKAADNWKMGAHCSRLNSRSGGNIADSLKLLKGDIGILNSGKLDEGINSVVVVSVDSKDSTQQALSKGGALYSFLDQTTTLKEWTLIDDAECDTLAKSNYDYNLWLGFSMKGASSKHTYATGTHDQPTLHLYKDTHTDQNTNYFGSMLSGVTLTRSLVTAPPNMLTPEMYVDRIKQEFKGLDVEVQVLARNELKTHGMNCLLGVARGSVHDPYVVTLHLKRNGSTPLALVGKGVTFDTGGLSLKPANAMMGMKKDMAGSAAVVGAIKTLALTKSDANVFGVVGLVENAISGDSYRPDDILISAAGKSVEIGNTDAEGRLVLCDLLHYTQHVLECKEIVDMATLTGAIITSLGSVYAGLFANDDKLAYHLAMAGKSAGERLWRMPLDADYAKLLESDVADLNNISGPKHGAGSITAAEFLHAFINPGTSWAHVDIAGVACNKGNKTASKDGTTGFGARLLTNFVKARANEIE